VIELTAPQLSDLRVCHGHGAENAGATTLSSTSHVFTWSYLMKNLIARFVKDESGATAIEYGLIAAGISLAIIAVVNGLGSNLNTKFTSINTSLK
jgi:pilus assembly protein Flp/PilA